MTIAERPNYMIFQHDAKRPFPLADGSVHCVVTSPPYWGLRDYGTPGQIGLESTPQEYVETMVRVFREVRRVLRDDGTCWLNLGDSYASGEIGRHDAITHTGNGGLTNHKVEVSPTHKHHGCERKHRTLTTGLKPKDLVGIPWRVALALQADGWYLRSDIVWHKPNPMPESVTDRPTKGHEYVFLMAKAERYHYDAEAVKEEATTGGRINLGFMPDRARAMGREPSGNEATGGRDKVRSMDRNLRTVWTIATQPYPGAHFATMPPKLAETCIKAGCPVGGIVFDPFNGAGTTGVVALGLGRIYIGCDNNADYLGQSKRRIDRPHAKPEPVRATGEPLPLFAST